MGYPVLLKPKIMQVVVKAGAIKRAKCQSNYQPSTNQYQTFYRPDALGSCCTTNSVKTPKGNLSDDSISSKLLLVLIFQSPPIVCGSVAEWLGRWTCDQQVASSNPGLSAIECNPGQVVNTQVPLSPSSIIWYQPMGGRAFRFAIRIDSPIHFKRIDSNRFVL